MSSMLVLAGSDVGDRQCNGCYGSGCVYAWMECFALVHGGQQGFADGEKGCGRPGMLLMHWCFSRVG